MWTHFNLDFFSCGSPCGLNYRCTLPKWFGFGSDTTLRVLASQNEFHINISRFGPRFWPQEYWNWNPKLMCYLSLDLRNLRRGLFSYTQNPFNVNKLYYSSDLSFNWGCRPSQIPALYQGFSVPDVASRRPKLSSFVPLWAMVPKQLD